MKDIVLLGLAILVATSAELVSRCLKGAFSQKGNVFLNAATLLGIAICASFSAGIYAVISWAVFAIFGVLHLNDWKRYVPPERLHEEADHK